MEVWLSVSTEYDSYNLFYCNFYCHWIYNWFNEKINDFSSKVEYSTIKFMIHLLVFIP